MISVCDHSRFSLRMVRYDGGIGVLVESGAVKVGCGVSSFLGFFCSFCPGIFMCVPLYNNGTHKTSCVCHASSLY